MFRGNIPYVKEFNSDGTLRNPIVGAYPSPAPNRSKRRKALRDKIWGPKRKNNRKTTRDRLVQFIKNGIKTGLTGRTDKFLKTNKQ